MLERERVLCWREKEGSKREGPMLEGERGF